MSIEGSYDLASFAVDARAEIRRLKAQLDLFWEQELALYRRLGLLDGTRILDCGCGPGYLLEKISTVCPAAECIGVEVDPALLEVAIESAKQKGMANCSFRLQSITEMDLPEGSFDFVIMRLVAEHLPEPLRAFREVNRVIKPGGVAVVVDNDFDFHERTWPECPALNELYDAYRRARRDEGGNPCIGRELPALLRQAGFEAVSLEMVAAHSQIIGDEAFLKAEGAGIPAQLVRTGFLEAEALERITEQWAAMLGQEGHAIFRTLFVASGRKPLTGRRMEVKEMDRASSQRPADSAPPESGNGKRSPSLLPEDLKRLMRQVLETDMDMAPESLSTSEPLIDAGVDSLAALKLCNRIKTDYAVALKIADVISGKSIDDLARDVLSQLESSEPAAATVSGIPVQPRSGAKTVIAG